MPLKCPKCQNVVVDNLRDKSSELGEDFPRIEAACPYCGHHWPSVPDERLLMDDNLDNIMNGIVGEDDD